MKALLLVSWIVPGQAISGYQAPFSTMELCKDAAKSIKSEAVRLQEEAYKLNGDPRRTIQISALCVAQ
jgi:hypothetical protein